MIEPKDDTGPVIYDGRLVFSANGCRSPFASESMDERLGECADDDGEPHPLTPRAVVEPDDVAVRLDRDLTRPVRATADGHHQHRERARTLDRVVERGEFRRRFRRGRYLGNNRSNPGQHQKYQQY